MRAWIFPFLALGCLVLCCRSRTPEGDTQEDPAGLRRLVLQVEGMVKVQGLT